jgi:hypothetical protein
MVHSIEQGFGGSEAGIIERKTYYDDGSFRHSSGSTRRAEFAILLARSLHFDRYVAFLSAHTPSKRE